MQSWLTVIVGLVLATASPPLARADADPKIRIAIIPSVAVNLDIAEVDLLTQALAEALVDELDIEAAGGLEVRRQLPVDGLPADCLTTPSCVDALATRLHATQLLFVVMIGTGHSIEVDSTWIEVVSGNTATRTPVDIASVADAKTRFTAVAKQLLPQAHVRSKSSTTPRKLDGRMSVVIPRHFTTPAKITGAIAVVGLGLGIALGIRTLGRYRDCEATGCDQSEHDSIRNTGLVADVGFVLAAGGAIATAVLYARSGERSHLIVAPTAESGSIVYAGTF